MRLVPLEGRRSDLVSFPLSPRHSTALSRLPLSEWQLPAGVPRGAWEYAQSEQIAGEYDMYFAENRLFEFDEQVVLTHFRRPGWVADLGAGTGRAVVALARRGFPGLAIDLSLPMLKIAAEKARRERLPVFSVLGNIAELDFLGDRTMDYALCLFSTLGMIRGRENRQQVLRHVRRILRPGGLFVLHVHNYWFNLFDPLGRRWLWKHGWERRWNREIERGDKFFAFHDIPQMFLHTFTRGELRRALAGAGFRLRQWLPLSVDRQRPLPHPWFFGRFRANGWIAVCE
jgi:SAM-dependent methyltransferase